MVDNLRLFFDVARMRSFSLAARERDVSQSAASQRIRQIEEKLGFVLFDRSARPLRLTVMGRKYYQGIREILSNYEKLVQEMNENQGRPHEVVRVASIYSVGVSLLTEICNEFRKEHPDVSVQVEYKHPREVERAVRLKDRDLGILSYPEKLKKLEIVPLRNEIMTVVCSPDHAFAKEGILHPSDLAGEPMVFLERTLPMAKEIHQYLRRNRVTPVIEHVFDNIDTVKSVLRDVRAVSILPRCTVHPELESGILVAVDLAPKIFRPVGLVHPRWPRNGRGPKSSSVFAFIEFLKAKAENASDGGRKSHSGAYVSSW